MKKRIKSCVVLLVFLLIVFLNALILGKNEDENTEEIKISSDEENTEATVVTREETMIEMAIAQMSEEMATIEEIEDKQKWFIAYKKIVDKYSYILDPPKTIYDYFSEEEIYLIQRAIETECYDQDFVSKTNVASVILNRIYSSGFGETVKEIITKPRQFVYGRKNITESTIAALEYAFEIEDTTNGCIAFRSDRKVDKWGSWTYVFTDDAGHHFYCEEGE